METYRPTPVLDRFHISRPGGLQSGLFGRVSLEGMGKKKRGRPSKHSKELEGGFLGAIASAARAAASIGRAATRFVPTLTRTARLAPTAARSTAIVPYNAAAAASRAASAARAARSIQPATSIASRLGTLGSRAMGAANVAALGLGIGLPIYQIIDMKKQQAEFDRQARLGDQQAAENSKAIQEAIDAAEDQQKFYEDATKQLEDARKLQQTEYERSVAEAERAYLEQAARDQEAMALAQAQQDEQLALLIQMEEQRQQQIEDAIRRSMQGVFNPTVTEDASNPYANEGMTFRPPPIRPPQPTISYAPGYGPGYGPTTRPTTRPVYDPYAQQPTQPAYNPYAGVDMSGNVSRRKPSRGSGKKKKKSVFFN
jgi:hypothetical protein